MDSFFGLDRIAPHDDSLELLTTVYDNAQLIITQSILRDAEIPFLAKDRGAGTSMKVIAGFSVFGTDIFVLREHLEIAKELLTPPEIDEDAEECDEGQNEE